MTTAYTLPALTDDQRAALEAFEVPGTRHGSDAWRAAVCDCWACGEDGNRPGLRQVRNHYGPSWLLDVYAWGWLPEAPPWLGLNGAASAGDLGRDRLKWSGDGSPPAVGARVGTFNGPGTVTGYFVEAGYLGVTVRTDAPKNGHPVGHYFGAELRPL